MSSSKNTEAIKESISRRNPSESAALVALFVFLLLNVSITAVDKLVVLRSVEADALLRYLSGAQFRQAQVVMIGSSLIGEPLIIESNSRLHTRQNATEKWTYPIDSTPVTQALKQCHCEGLHTAEAISIPGMMISDMYLLVDHFLSGHRVPKFLVCAVAPRDFNGNAIVPKTTPTFEALAGIPDGWTSCQSMLPTLEQKLDFFANQIIRMRAKRITTQTRLSWSLKSYINRLVPEPAPKPIDRLSQMESGYATQYAIFTPLGLDIYEKALLKLLQVCQSRGIKVMVIEMPLSQRFQKHIPTDVMARYHSLLRNACSTYDAILMDETDSFQDQAFRDGVHLTPDEFRTLLLRCMKVLCAVRQHNSTAPLGE